MIFHTGCEVCAYANTSVCASCHRCNAVFSSDHFTPRFGMNFYDEYVTNDIKITKEIAKDIMSTDYSKMFNKYEATLMPKIKKVIFNPPATIVLWEDNTKTVVKAQIEGFDPEKGLAMAISKKYLGNKGKYYNTFEKYISEWEKENDELMHPSNFEEAFESFIKRVYDL